ncbi:MAG: DoxX family protein, partial [Muribaculaceae bacterium]|nr:DoxX family protein [Muribaculaceae bacterium]
MAKPEKDNRSVITILLVWLFRFLVGATFIVSGWAKAIDPWGTIYKVEEYFTVWGLYVPREITLALAVILAICEFSVGVLVFLGSMRRASVWLAAAFMVVMLPLTAYIAIA